MDENSNLDAYQPTPYNERESQKLGVWDYIKDVAVPLLIPFAGMGIGTLLHKPTKGLINGTRGLIGGTIITGFMAWRKEEKKRLEVADTVAEVKDIAHLHQTNEDLEKENKLLEKMINFERKKHAANEKNPEGFQQREDARIAESKNSTLEVS
jgi:chorismate mutase